MRKLFAALLASVALGLAGGAVADDKPEAIVFKQSIEILQDF